MKAPEGYRELNVLEEIKKGDVFKDGRIANSSAGESYDPEVHILGRFRKIEPARKFKVGDKVVVVDKTIGDSFSWNWDKARDSQGFLYVNESNFKCTINGMVPYVCGERQIGGDYFNESDLIPYVEKQETKKENMSIEEAYIQMQKECGIEVGDTVKVLRKAKDYEMGWSNSWVGCMDVLVGETFKVKFSGGGGVQLSNDYCVPFFVLELVSKSPKVVKVKLNENHTAEVSKDGIKVGCQTFPIGIVEELEKAIKSLEN
jgi:hypothetical protein